MTLSELFDKADEMVAKRYPDCNASIKEMNSYRDGYIHGMTERLEGMIPIEKACEVLKKHLFTQVVGRYDGEYSHFIQEVYTQVFPKFATAEDMIMVLRSEMEE